jgi:hypothetical protein
MPNKLQLCKWVPFKGGYRERVQGASIHQCIHQRTSVSILFANFEKIEKRTEWKNWEKGEWIEEEKGGNLDSQFLQKLYI